MRRIRPFLAATAIAAAALAGCYDDEFPEDTAAGAADAGHDHAEGGCEALGVEPMVELGVTPGHLHPGVVATLTFTVMDGGAPAEGLEPVLTYRIDGGAAIGPVPLAAGEAPGTYVVERTLSDAGTYALEFEDGLCETTEPVDFQLVVGGTH